MIFIVIDTFQACFQYSNRKLQAIRSLSSAQLLAILMQYAGATYVLLLMCFLLKAIFSCLDVYERDVCYVPMAIGSWVFFSIVMNWAFFLSYAKYNKPGYYTKPDVSFAIAQQRENGIKREQQTVRRERSRLRGNGTVVIDMKEGSPIPDESDWKYCKICREWLPRRCHHCPVCNYCVLRKDHHCFMIGACVGLGNLRYFIVWNVYAMFSSLYGALWSYRVASHYLPSFWGLGSFDYFLPFCVVKWLLLKHVSLNVVGLVAILNAGLSNAWCCFGFFGVHMWYLVTGRTLYEAMGYGIETDDGLTIGQRTRAVFGPNWAVNFVIPRHYRSKLDPKLAQLFAARYGAKDV